MRLICFFLGLYCVIRSEVIGLICNDINSQACQLLEASKPDMCNDTTISTTTCPRYCGKCALECYHCPQALVNITDCNSTQACHAGQVCMLKELRSTADSHHEYIMTCEEKTHCDGTELTFPFGRRRGIETRDINVKCCDRDLCNYPVTATTTATSIPVQTGCLKDVIIIVDESLSMRHYQHDILNFLASVVEKIGVSMQGTHVSLATYAATAHKQFNLNDYYNVQDLANAIRNVHFRGGDDNIAFGISYVIREATTPANGDRTNVPDVVLFITDHTATSYIARIYEQSLHSKISDVIAIGVGSHVSTQELQQIATDVGHVLQVRDSDDLDQYQVQIVKLICN